MSDGPVNFTAARVLRSGDGRDWTPEQMLEWLLGEIKGGRVTTPRMTIHFAHDRGPDRWSHSYCSAGMSTAEHVALLAVAQRVVIDNWQE